MKPRAILCDLDGTLCNIEHRRRFLQQTPKDWKSFFEFMPHDKPNFNVAHVVRSFAQSGYQVIFVTGRMEMHRIETNKWLKKWFPEFSHFPVLMRKNQDFRDDSLVKEEIYSEKIAPNFHVELVIDDRKKVCEMWRRMELECWAVAEGDY